MLVITSLLQARSLAADGWIGGQSYDAGLRHLWIMLAHLLVFELTMPVMGFWIVRAQKNVRALGAAGLGYSPAMALGRFFIPFGQLFLPARAMGELERASEDPISWQHSPGGRFTDRWWFAWGMSCLLHSISSGRIRSSESVDELISASYMQAVVSTAHLAACLLACLCPRGEHYQGPAQARAVTPGHSVRLRVGF
ncbi:MAG: hypothetical protein ACI82F_000310 [Planctomycetota bacterium]